MANKRVPVTLVLRLEVDVPEDWGDDAIQFFVEENHCLDNYVVGVAREIAEEGDVATCHTCLKGAAFVGHHDLHPEHKP